MTNDSSRSAARAAANPRTGRAVGPSPDGGRAPVVFTPSTLTREVRQLLELSLPSIQVEGEISNLARPSSGHLYFTLKDDNAQVRCALFKGRAAGLRHRPENGDQVRVHARASVYPARGEFQLVVEHLEDAGVGRLQRAFEALKARLNEEGLFDERHRRPLPSQPRRLGVITSPTGAAIRDVLTVLARRFPGLPVRIHPVPVQGAESAPAIVQALEVAAERRECDVLLLTRGGGSLEDLWSFNEEAVARAIHRCPIPVVSAVGHEVDMTIADLVADYRAATPSAAAELLSPDGAAWAERFRALEQRTAHAVERRLQRLRQQLGHLHSRLDAQHPHRRLLDRSQRLDELEQRMQRAIRGRIAQRREAMNAVRRRLQPQRPDRLVEAHRRALTRLDIRLERAARMRLKQAEQRLTYATRALETVSPLATLQRGYAVASRKDGTIVRDSNEVAAGEHITIQLHRGGLDARVERIWPDDSD